MLRACAKGHSRERSTSTQKNTPFCLLRKHKSAEEHVRNDGCVERVVKAALGDAVGRRVDVADEPVEDAVLVASAAEIPEGDAWVLSGCLAAALELDVGGDQASQLAAHKQTQPAGWHTVES